MENYISLSKVSDFFKSEFVTQWFNDCYEYLQLQYPDYEIISSDLDAIDVYRYNENEEDYHFVHSYEPGFKEGVLSLRESYSDEIILIH